MNSTETLFGNNVFELYGRCCENNFCGFLRENSKENYVNPSKVEDTWKRIFLMIQVAGENVTFKRGSQE